MALKPKARESMLTQLESEDLSDLGIDLYGLDDRDLKTLYLKSQAVRSGGVQWGLSKDVNFQDALDSGNFQYVSFSDTYKLGTNRLTLKQCLLIEASPNFKHKLWKNW